MTSFSLLQGTNDNSLKIAFFSGGRARAAWVSVCVGGDEFIKYINILCN